MFLIHATHFRLKKKTIQVMFSGILISISSVKCKLTMLLMHWTEKYKILLYTLLKKRKQQVAKLI